MSAVPSNCWPNIYSRRQTAVTSAQITGPVSCTSLTNTGASSLQGITCTTLSASGATSIAGLTCTKVNASTAVAANNPNPTALLQATYAHAQGTSKDMLTLNYDNNWGLRVAQNYQDGIQYEVYNKAATVETLALSFKNGNVGVKNSNPTRPLDVTGNAAISGTLDVTGATSVTGLTQTYAGNDGGAAIFHQIKTRGSGNGATLVGDELARNNFYGVDTSNVTRMSGLTVCKQSAASGSNYVPTQYEIWTSDTSGLGATPTLTVSRSGISTAYNITSSAGTVNGATVKIGSQSSAPALKTRSWGTTAAGSTLTSAAAGSLTTIAHGVTQANIVNVHAVIDGTSQSVQPNYPSTTYNFSVYWDATNIYIAISAGATDVAAKPCRVVLWYY